MGIVAVVPSKARGNRTMLRLCSDTRATRRCSLGVSVSQIYSREGFTRDLPTWKPRCPLGESALAVVSCVNLRSGTVLSASDGHEV